MSLQQLLFDENGTLRSGYRFAIFGVGFFILTLFLGGLAYAALMASGIGTDSSSSASFFVSGVVSLIAALVVGWLCGKYIEHLPFSSLGASFAGGWLKHLILGLLLGAITFALAAGIGAVTGRLSFAPNEQPASSIASTLFVSFLVLAAAAAFEEALFRGYALQTFVRSNLTAFGVFLTAMIFATVHNANPSANALSWLNTFIAGIWLGIAYLKTRDLWLPFGLHLAWNWTQGSVFGVEVSGLTDIIPAPLLRETDIGPSWLTGGEYGVEGGVVTTIALLASIAAIYFFTLPIDRTKQSES